MKRTVELPQSQTIDIEYDETVYSPAHSSVDAILLSDIAVQATFGVGVKVPKVLDLACGSGVMALAIKKLHPEADVSACDISEEAISTTLKNMLALDLFIKLFKSDLLKKAASYDVIVTNLPTYDREDMVKHRLMGPDMSYFADETDGLKLYRAVFKDIKEHLNKGGYLIIECQKKLHPQLESLGVKSGFDLLAKTDFAFAFQLQE